MHVTNYRLPETVLSAHVSVIAGRADPRYFRTMARKPKVKPEPLPLSPWYAIARAALAGELGKHLIKLNRRRLVDLCEELAAGMPLELVCRKHGFQPHTVREWATTHPAAWAAIEKARSVGEELHLSKIHAAADWRAAERSLTICRPEYAPAPAGAAPGGIAVQVVLQVPVPVALAAGQSARIVEIEPAEGEPVKAISQAQFP